MLFAFAADETAREDDPAVFLVLDPAFVELVFLVDGPDERELDFDATVERVAEPLFAAGLFFPLEVDDLLLVLDERDAVFEVEAFFFAGMSDPPIKSKLQTDHYKSNLYAARKRVFL